MHKLGCTVHTCTCTAYCVLHNLHTLKLTDLHVSLLVLYMYMAFALHKTFYQYQFATGLCAYAILVTRHSQLRNINAYMYAD